MALPDRATGPSRPVERAYPQVALSQAWSYDQFGRAADIAAAFAEDPNDPNSNLITHFNYGFDKENNITSQGFGHRPAAPVSSYGYDDLNRLTSVEYFSNPSDSEAFDYDLLGNRESVGLRSGATENYAVNDVNNQYNSIDGTALTYDAAGNLIEDDKGYSYKWDHENHLLAVYKDNGTTQVVEYVYDALGRRIKKTLFENNTPGLAFEYHYNGWQLLMENLKLGSLNFYRDYVYGNSLDETLVCHYRYNDSNLYLVHDHLNSPAALIADYDNGSNWSAGEIAERYEFDAYGKRHVFNADYSVKADNYYYTNVGYTGQRYDLLDGSNPAGPLILCYYKNRWYLPEQGRFLSNDPLGVVPEGFENKLEPNEQYSDGLNVYCYVGNGPVEKLDIYGLVEGDPTSPYNLSNHSAQTHTPSCCWCDVYLRIDKRAEHFFHASVSFSCYDKGKGKGYKFSLDFSPENNDSPIWSNTHMKRRAANETEETHLFIKLNRVSCETANSVTKSCGANGSAYNFAINNCYHQSLMALEKIFFIGLFD